MKYKSNDVSEFLSLANLTINFNSNMGVVPPVLLDEFYDEHNAFQTHFEYKKENGKEYLDIKGSKFFTDTWEIKRLDNDCCKISLSTEDKYF